MLIILLSKYYGLFNILLSHSVKFYLSTFFIPFLIDVILNALIKPIQSIKTRATQQAHDDTIACKHFQHDWLCNVTGVSFLQIFVIVTFRCLHGMPQQLQTHIVLSGVLLWFGAGYICSFPSGLLY